MFRSPFSPYACVLSEAAHCPASILVEALATAVVFLPLFFF
ncbi:MAG: hypothetical protein AAFT19_04505 [Pseudomonadota bacterium]